MARDGFRGGRLPRRRRNRSDLFGGVAVVSGAGSGIGKATALALHRRGSTVAVLDIDIEAAELTVKEIVDLGGSASAMAVDVSDRSAMGDVANRIDDELGPMTIVVNNAGVGMSGRFHESDLEDWDWIRSINLDGVVNGCHIFGQRLLDQGRGHVINMSSGLAYTPRATEPHYVTTKAAVLALSRCLRADWGRLGVGVTAVCPGVIDTPIYQRSRVRGDQSADKVQARTQRLFSRGHSPEKVGEAVCDAIAANRGVAPVGWESRLGLALDGLVPEPIQTRIARVSIP